MVGRHQANRTVIVLPVVDRPVEDDSSLTDVFTVATRVIVRGTAHFISSSLIQQPVGFLAARVVVAMAVQPHFIVH